MGYDPQANELRPLNDEQAKTFAEKSPHFLFQEGETVPVKGVVFTIKEIGLQRLILKPLRATDWLHGNVKTTEAMQPHQQRVVTEKEELDDKIGKLDTFIHGPIYLTLPDVERSRMMRQFCHMKDYSNVLAERIAAF